MTYDQNFFPWDDIPDSGVLLAGMYQMRGESLSIETTSTGKRMIVMQAVVEQPEAYAGMRIFENFVIGIEEDPMGAQRETWLRSVGARRLKGLLKAANVPQSNDLNQICNTFAGVMFLTQATQYEEQSGDYKGSIRNRFNFYKVGERVVGVEGKPMGARGAAPQAVPQAVPPQTAQPTATPSPSGTVPGQPTVQPQAQPVPTPQPQAQPSAEVMIPCGNCNQSFPASQFGAHVQACLAGQQQTA